MNADWGRREEDVAQVDQVQYAGAGMNSEYAGAGMHCGAFRAIHSCRAVLVHGKMGST